MKVRGDIPELDLLVVKTPSVQGFIPRRYYGTNVQILQRTLRLFFMHNLVCGKTECFVTFVDQKITFFNYYAYCVMIF